MGAHRLGTDPGQPAIAAPASTIGRALGAHAADFPQIPDGTRVRIYAVARQAETPLTSPVRERECLAYRLVVQEPGWHQVLERAACTSFAVQDGGVTVNVRGPFHVFLQDDYDWEFSQDIQTRIARLIDEERQTRARARTSWLWRALRAIAAFDAPAGPTEPSRRDAIYRQNYRFFEALIRPGDRVAVEGFASVTVAPGGERSGLRAPPLLYRLSGTPERPAIVSVPEPGSVAP